MREIPLIKHISNLPHKFRIPTYKTLFESSNFYKHFFEIFKDGSSKKVLHLGLEHFARNWMTRKVFYTWVFEIFERDWMARKLFYTCDFWSKEISLTSKMDYFVILPYNTIFETLQNSFGTLELSDEKSYFPKKRISTIITLINTDQSYSK